MSLDTLSLNPSEVSKHFEEEIQKMLPLMKNFLGRQTEIQIVLQDDPKASTFSFAPATKSIQVPQTWYTRYLQGEHLHTPELFQFILLHEAGHYRDLLKEEEITGTSTMLRCLMELTDKKIVLSPQLAIPTGEILHDIYNYIDDVVVNTDVMKYNAANASPAFVSTTYQTYNFPLFTPVEQGGEYQTNGRGKPLYRPQRDGNLTINTAPEVAMEEIPQYKIFSTHFLRDKMVQGQKIILPPQLRQILLTDTGGQRSWKSSLQQTFQLLKQTQTEMETNLKDEKNLTPKRQARLKQLKTPYLLHMHTIEDLSQPAALRKIEQLLLTSGIKETPDYQKGMLTTGLLSLEQLVHLFTQTRGIDDDHRMYILPAQRYLLIQAIFEPIIESLIFMDLAQRDAPPPKKNNNNADKKKRGKKTGEGKETGEGVFEQSLEEKIATLKKIIDEKKEKARQQEKDRPKKPLYALFNSTDFTQADVECYHQIKENFKHHIQTFTEFLYKQLEQMDWTEHLEWETAKKGKWNTPAAHKAITQDPIGLDIHKKFLYQRPSSHWEINTTFKQLHIMLMVDISGSTDSFKGTKGITNGLTTIIITALKLVEERIQQLLQTREKFINFDVVLYADGIGFSTMDNPHYQKMNHEEKAALINKKIIHLSGGTDDATGWRAVSEHLLSHFDHHPETVQSLQDKQKKLMVIQIADSDVSVNGVDILKQALSNYKQDITPAIEIKRIIMGQMRDKAVPLTNGHFADTYKYDPTTKLPFRIIKEVGIRSMKEILDNLEAIFDHLFLESMIKKVPPQHR